MSKVRTRAKAFTLVELLVVISIIAMLLAILMPSLSMVRAKGRQIVCKANLHTLLQASFVYAQNNKDVIHPAVLSTDTRFGDKEDKSWYYIMIPYYPVKQEFWKCPADMNKNVKKSYKANRTASIRYYTPGSDYGKIKKSNFGPGDHKSQNIIQPSLTIMYTCMQYTGTGVDPDVYDNSNVAWGGTGDYIGTYTAGKKGVYNRPHSKNDEVSLYGMLDGRTVDVGYKSKDPVTGIRYLDGAKWSWDTGSDTNFPWR